MRSRIGITVEWKPRSISIRIAVRICGVVNTGDPGLNLGSPVHRWDGESCAGRSRRSEREAATVVGDGKRWCCS